MPQLMGKTVGDVGFGLMSLTARSSPLTHEQMFKCIKTAIDANATCLNGGDFYGPPDANSLQLLRDYFAAYPEDKEKVLISIKGGMTATYQPDNSPASVRKSVLNALDVMGIDKLDVWEQARQDPNVPIEDAIGAMKQLIEEGKLGGISLSECGAETIRRAAKVHPIAMVEVEFSLFATQILENGVGTTCAELGIPIIAYSPIGKGFLTGQIRKPEDIPEGDFRKNTSRFQGDNFWNNMKLVHEVERLAKTKGCTPGQLAISWVKKMGGRRGLPKVVIPIPGASTEARILENSTSVELTEDDMTEIDKVLDTIVIQGERYHGHLVGLEFA